MTRKKLASCRASQTFEFVHCYPSAGPRKFTASAGFYPDGKIGEAFAHAVDGKEKLLNPDHHDAAIVLSLAIQHGASLKTMAASMLRGENGEPHGFLGALLDSLVEMESEAASIRISSDGVDRRTGDNPGG